MITTPIPVFPLSLVLLPGADVPLHIFEPRYRAMIRDVSATSRRFGLIAPPPNTAEADLPAGRVGCIARVTGVETLDDGRLNITVEGAERFRFETYVDGGTSYRMAHVSAYEDLPTADDALIAAEARLREVATRAIRASMTVHDTKADLPALDADPRTLPFQVAQMLRVSNAVLYDLLADRNPLSRLERVEAMIRDGLDPIESAAELHVRAKTNGHHHGPPPD